MKFTKYCTFIKKDIWNNITWLPDMWLTTRFTQGLMYKVLWSFKKNAEPACRYMHCLSKTSGKATHIYKTCSNPRVIYRVHDFTKSLQISMESFAPHLKGFTIKLHQHKQTKLFSIFILIIKNYDVLYSVVVVKILTSWIFIGSSLTYKTNTVFRLNGAHI